MTDSKLKLSLFAIRFTLFLFFSVWAIEKFIKPETTVAIWKAFIWLIPYRYRRLTLSVLFRV